MKFNFKVFSIQGFIFLFSCEIFSSILLFTGIIPDVYSQRGIKSPKNIIFQGISWRTENQPWGAWHKKNSYSRHLKECFDVVYESNNIGARDIENYNNNFSEESVVALGDSFMEGYGLNHKDTFAFKLQKKINQKVFNLGSANNFGPLQYYMVYKNLGKDLPHSSVILFFLPSNDFDDNDFNNVKKMGGERYRPYHKLNHNNGKYEIVYPKSSIKRVNIGRNKLHNYLIAQATRSNAIRLYKSIKILSKYRTPKKKLFSFTKGSISQQEAVIHFLKKTYELAKKRGVKTFTILSIPRENDFKEYQKNNFYRKEWWETELEKFDKLNNDFVYVNGFEIITKKRTNFHERLFHSCDSHWSKEGSSLYSDLIYKKIFKTKNNN